MVLRARRRPRFTGAMPLKLLPVAVLLAALAGVAVALLPGAAGTTTTPGPSRSTPTWRRGRAATTAAPRRSPTRRRRAARGLRLSREGLDGATVAARLLGPPSEAGRARVQVSWTVPRFGAFRYDDRADRGGRRGGARACTGPSVPSIPGWTARHASARAWRGPAAAPILDRAGRPLVSERPVVDIAVKAGDVRDPEATAAALAASSTSTPPRSPAGSGTADAGPLPAGHHPPAGGLRARAEQLDAIPGVTTEPDLRSARPDPGLRARAARHGRPATAEQVEAAGGRLARRRRRRAVRARAGPRRAACRRAERRVVIRYRSTGIAARTLAAPRRTPRPRALRTRSIATSRRPPRPR